MSDVSQVFDLNLTCWFAATFYLQLGQESGPSKNLKRSRVTQSHGLIRDGTIFVKAIYNFLLWKRMIENILE